MATKQPNGGFIIAAGEVGAFSVCQESWRLQWVEKSSRLNRKSESALGKELHANWSALFDESLLFGRWSRYIAVLLCVAVSVFLFVKRPGDPLDRMFDFSQKLSVFELILIVATAIVVIRLMLGASRGRKSEAGLSEIAKVVSVDGSNLIPGREYISQKQGLAGKPDALVVEHGISIPVERKPLAKKIRDRYVAQLLIYMRLVEEFEGTRPPYGILILGPTSRRVQVENSEKKQRWADTLLSQMREILKGGKAKATPHPIKCAKCDVRHRCTEAYKEQTSVSDNSL